MAAVPPAAPSAVPDASWRVAQNPFTMGTTSTRAKAQWGPDYSNGSTPSLWGTLPLPMPPPDVFNLKAARWIGHRRRTFHAAAPPVFAAGTHVTLAQAPQPKVQLNTPAQHVLRHITVKQAAPPSPLDIAMQRLRAVGERKAALALAEQRAVGARRDLHGPAEMQVHNTSKVISLLISCSCAWWWWWQC